MSSDKVRVLVFAIFFLGLIIFAVTYRPTDAFSHPANQNNSAAQQAAQGE